jgi:NAD(P)-dependent dehydrogenase (short-subunit alcohol dehydrogenase family)
MRAAVKLDSGLTDQDWATMINVDIMGVVRCARAVGPHMIKQRSGKIINIGSIEGYGHVDGENDTAYALAIAAVHRFTQALALEWAPFNINVNVIAPGYYHTEILRHPEWNITSQEAHASIAKFRGGDMRDLGLLAVFMASDAANFMTGEIITCDGGTLKRGKLMGEEKAS